MSKPKKPRPIKDFDVVFTDKGDLHRTSYFSPQYSGFKIEKNRAYSDTLEYAGYSSNRIMFVSLNTGRKYHMFMSDFDEIVKEKMFVDNKVIGLFCFCRKGSRQGIRMVFEP